MHTFAFKGLFLEWCPVYRGLTLIRVHAGQSQVNDCCPDSMRIVVHGHFPLSSAGWLRDWHILDQNLPPVQVSVLVMIFMSIGVSTCMIVSYLELNQILRLSKSPGDLPEQATCLSPAILGSVRKCIRFQIRATVGKDDDCVDL